MKLLILPCAEKLESYVSTAPKTWDNTDRLDLSPIQFPPPTSTRQDSCRRCEKGITV